MKKYTFRESRHIKIRLPATIRLWLTTKLLNWAEKRPQAENGFLYQLQAERGMQRELANSNFERTRPPKGTELEILGIRIYEVFHYEDFENVLTGLIKLFPNIDSQKWDETFTIYFQRLSESITMSGWKPIGYLYGNNPIFFGSSLVQKVDKLNSYINYVKVGLYKPLPSLMILTFDIVLVDDASEKLNQLQSDNHLGQASLNKIHMRPLLLGIGHHMPDNAQTDAILEWLAEIRMNVEKIIRPFVNGHFMNNIESSCKLPAIEIYGLKGVKSTKARFITWANNARHWWLSLGFNFFRGALFGNTEVVFAWRGNRQNKTQPQANRIIVFPEKFIKQSEKKLQPRNISATIWNNLRYLLDSIITPIAIVEFQIASIQNLEKLRRLIYDAIKHKKFFSNSLSKYISLYQNFQQTGILLRRLSLEYKENGEFIKYEIKNTDSWMEIDMNKRNKAIKKEGAFSANLNSRIDNLNRLLINQLDFIEKSFSSHIEFLNIDAIYRLQVATYFLTFAATIAALVGLLLNWEQIIEKATYLWMSIFP